MVKVIYVQGLVLCKTVHALSNHTKAFLYSIFKGATDSHHLAYGLHARTNLAVHATELTKVPTWQFCHDIVQCWLEEGRGIFGNGVFEFKESVSECNLRCYEREWIARCF